MARLVTTNMAASVLASSLGGTSGDTSLALSAGTGALFPTLPYTGDYFSAVLINTSGQYEIVKVTGRSTDTLTIVRGQQGTTIKAFSAGDRVELRLTASDINFMMGSYWSRESAAVARVDGANFTVAGDQTLVYVQYRAVRAIQTSTGTGFVTASSYSAGTGLTTVTVEGLTIDSGLAAMEYGQDPTSAPKYGAYPSASTSVAGVTAFATNAETATGTEAGKAVTPAGLASLKGSVLQVYDADTCISDVAKSYTAQHYAAATALTSASTVTFDNATCALSTLTLGHNATLGDPSNKVAGQEGLLIVTGASTYTLSGHANWKMADGTTWAFAPVASKNTWIWWYCDGTYNWILGSKQEA